MLLSRISSTLLAPFQRRCFSSTADMEIDNLVIGAGVVGLALGEKLTRERPSEVTVVVDRHKRYGEETSSRNSEVIHAGIYYPKDSLKTRLCIQGNRKLYELLLRARIPYQKVGKLVVAHSAEQHAYLKSLHQKATELGVETHLISGEGAVEMEPELRAHSALYSPSTGIIDSHALMDYLHNQIVDNGGDVALYTSVTYIKPDPQGGYRVQLETPPNTSSDVLARRVFNAAGLHADKISNMVVPGKYKLHYARGCYYAYSDPLGVKHLIYPCPVKNLAGLGTHLTLDMAGKVKFGPDVQYIDSPSDYTVPDLPENRRLFAEAVKAFLPSIQASKLQPDYAGIRPKLAGPGEPFRDFEIKQEDGLENFFTLIGIESPGLTSCLAIADYVHDLIRD